MGKKNMLEKLREDLEQTIEKVGTQNLTNEEIVRLSQKLDTEITLYYEQDFKGRFQEKNLDKRNG